VQAVGAVAAEPLRLVVMDPLSAQLACKCVQGYAQRNYQQLGDYLHKRLGREVEVLYAEDLLQVLQGEQSVGVDLVIGKDSVVRADAAQGKLKIRPLAMLTGLDGQTTLRGLFVVRREDPAVQLPDLIGYQIYFGPAEAVEKHGAALAALREAKVTPPSPRQVRPSCADAALAVLESPEQRAAAVISSYAVPLLEGCGTIERGALRVIGQTEPVPFIGAFATQRVDKPLGDQIREALLAVRDQAPLLAALESKHGFVPIQPASPSPSTSPQPPTTAAPPGDFGQIPTGLAPVSGLDRPQGPAKGPAEWPGWRGPNRDGLSPWLPERLPSQARFVWRKRLTGSSLAGVVVAAERVVVSDKDAAEENDIWRCLDARTGEQVWKFTYRAGGNMDYGNAPRATPLIHADKVYLLSALGDLHCLGLKDGQLLWKKNLLVTFGGKLPTWGICASPLLVDGRLIVGAGGLDGSVAALNPASGDTIWQGPGKWTAYASPIAGLFGGQRQVITYDAESLGGWDLATGERLWRLVPPESGDFNVPTPVACGDRLLISSENNGTRLHAFGEWGVILPRPVAVHPDLAPDSATPVLVDGRLYGCHEKLYCLDVAQGLKEVWVAEDPAFDHYVTIIASPQRLLLTATRGELLLVAAGAPRYQLLSRLQLFDDDCEVMAQPALVGTRLYVRSDSVIACLDLGDLPTAETGRDPSHATQ